MKSSKSKTTRKTTGQPDKPISQPAVLPSEAFLADAKNEAKRNLLTDHTRTIVTLRDEKRFTFRAIADWLGERGVETDHSAVYRVYLAAIPEHERDDPTTNWAEVNEPDYADENVAVKQPAGTWSINSIFKS